MTKDIGIVLLPNQECREFTNFVTKTAARELPGFQQVQNNPHITLIHIANLNQDGELRLEQAFHEFNAKFSTKCIYLPIKGLNATGGSATEGFKWLDLQFYTSPNLAIFRQDAVKIFGPLHNGTLTRMNDDIAKFTPMQLLQIKRYGVTVDNYVPHITAWYIDLPKEQKTTVLQDVANSLKDEWDYLHCFADAIAMGYLGRNGNIETIKEQFSLPTCQLLGLNFENKDEL